MVKEVVGGARSAEGRRSGNAAPRRSSKDDKGDKGDKKKSTGAAKKRRSENARTSGGRLVGVGGLAEEDLLRSRGLTPDKVMGKGAYSKVRKCQRQSDGAWVAVKIINRAKASDRFLKTFLPRELAISASVKHGGVVSLMENWTVDGTTCLVMELAARGDLEQYISLKGAFSVTGLRDSAHSIFRQILEALVYIHGLGIVHRDLKCENVFLDSGLAPKIGDFGFARKMEAGDLSKTFCGSPAYAAPELLSQTPYKGAAADVWSCGVIFYIMLSARMPFDDRNLPAMIAHQKAEKIPFSTRTFDATSKALTQSLLKAEPDDRLSAKEALSHAWFTGA